MDDNTRDIRKHRSQRACDVCRQKKIRCDGADMPDNRCTGCIARNVSCTYEGYGKRRSRQDVSLGERLTKMENLLDKVQPTRELKTIRRRTSWPSSAATSPTQSFSFDDSEIEQQGIPQLTEGMKNLYLPGDRYRQHYHGKSSAFNLLMQARGLKDGSITTLPPSLQWKFRRPEFWQETRNMYDHNPLASCIFPSPELAKVLIDALFTAVHPCSLVIHRASFEKCYYNNDHKVDPDFAALVLMTFALACKLIPDQVPNDGPPGKLYYDQARPHLLNALSPVSLVTFQGLVLLSYFQFLLNDHHMAWTSIGTACRFGQDVGAHRKKQSGNSTEAEMWKRSFWLVLIQDRNLSANLGRPVACQLEDMDLEFPVALDEDEEQAIVYLNCLLRLSNILSEVLCMLYPIKKPPLLAELLGDEYERTIVVQLDSRLNEWIDSVPDYLRWNPDNEDLTTLEQSLHLHTKYFYVQLFVHRPFIPTRNKPSVLTFPSLAICTNAARSCSHLLDVARKRSTRLLSIPVAAAYASALVLLMVLWDAKNSGVTVDEKMQLMDINACVRFLISQEKSNPHAGKLVDIIRELASFALGDVTLPEDPDTPSKRDREDDLEAEEPPPRLKSQRTPAAEMPMDNYLSPASESKFDQPAYQTEQLVPSVPQIHPYQTISFSTAALSQSILEQQCPRSTSPAPGADFTFASRPSLFNGDAVYIPPHVQGTHGEGSLPPTLPIQHGSYDPPFWDARGFGDSVRDGRQRTSGPPVTVDITAPPFDGDYQGLWSFAPPGFEWTQWEDIIDALKIQSA